MHAFLCRCRHRCCLRPETTYPVSSTSSTQSSTAWPHYAAEVNSI